MLIHRITSPLVSLPSLPEPSIFLISILFSSTIFLTAGERVWLLSVLITLGLVLISLFKTKGCSPFCFVIALFSNLITFLLKRSGPLLSSTSNDFSIFFFG